MTRDERFCRARVALREIESGLEKLELAQGIQTFMYGVTLCRDIEHIADQLKRREAKQ